MPSSATSVGEQWTVRVTPNDGNSDGAYTESSVTVVNSAPTVDSIGIAPNSSVYNDTTLSCAAVVSDADETVTASYEWTVNGLSYAGASLDLSSTNAMPTDSVSCTASVTDSEGDSDSQSTSVVVENRNPSVSGVSISPSVVYNDTVLTCTGTATDADEAVTASIEWFVAGQSVGTGSSIDLETTAAMPGDVVDCVMSVSDSNGGSDSMTESATVQNRAPVVSSVSKSAIPLRAWTTSLCHRPPFIDQTGTASYSFDWTHTVKPTLAVP